MAFLHLLNIDYVPGIILSVSPAFSHLLLIMTLWRKYSAPSSSTLKHSGLMQHYLLLFRSQLGSSDVGQARLISSGLAHMSVSAGGLTGADQTRTAVAGWDSSALPDVVSYPLACYPGLVLMVAGVQ